MEEARKNPCPQEIYRHFKGNRYKIVTLAEDSESGKTLVIYQALYGENKVYARELENFCEKLDKTRYPEAKQVYRFEKELDEDASGEKEEAVLDPLVEEFLNADGTKERLSILTALHPRITNEMIDVCAIASGVEVGPGDPEDRWKDLRDCLLTIERYEQSRDRLHG